MTASSYFARVIHAGEEAFVNGDNSGYTRSVRIGGKILRDLANAGQIDTALAYEPYWYNRLVKKVEDEAHYYESFSWHRQAFWDAGFKESRLQDIRTDPYKIAFLSHTGALLGHTEVMLEVLRGWRRLYPKIDIVFVCLGDLQLELAQRLKKLRVPCLAAPRTLGPSGAVRWAKDLFCRQQISTVVWLSTPCMVSYAFAMRMAPKQVFWSLKFHGVHLGPTVLHIGMTKPADGEVTINGAPWVAYSPPLTLASIEPSPQRAAELRQKWPGMFLFGTLAREEKFNSPPFLDAIVRILMVNPNAHFIYTGKKPPISLVNRLESAGLQSRSTYIGWVDTNLYAQVIDVFLETFPFGCGITGAQAIQHGTRIISLWSEDTLPRFYFQSFEEAHHFSPMWDVCFSIDDYVNKARDAYLCGRRPAREAMSQMRMPSLASLDLGKAEKLRRLIGLPAS